MSQAATSRVSPVRLRAPGLVLGVGLGGFVDGILLHQVLQWHHMVSAVHPPVSLGALERNTAADGLFHSVTWVAVVAGLALLWRARREQQASTWRSLLGWVLAGWGLFNLVEGVVDHHVLQLHRVRPDAASPLLWDLGFLALGALLLAVGILLARSDVGSGGHLTGRD